MDANGLLAFIAIIVAAYTVLSEEKRLDIKIRSSKRDYVLLSIGLIVILWVIYLPVCKELGLVIPLPWMWGFNEERTVFTSCLLLIIYSCYRYNKAALSKSSLTKLGAVSTRLLAEKKLAELVYLFDKYHEQLLLISGRKPWYVKLHDWIVPPHYVLLARLKDESIHRYQWIRVLLRPLAQLLSDKYSAGLQAENIITNLFKSKQFIQHIGLAHPLTAAKFTTAKFPNREEYTTYLIQIWMAESTSVFYRELKDNQSCSYTGKYYLDPTNAVLNFFLQDLSIAVDIGIWKPIGDFTTEFIDQQRGPNNLYNQPAGRFPDGDERWQCPIFCSIIFFDVMVSQSLFQNKKDHMWLMYIEYYVEHMLRNLDPHDDVNLDSEFPTRFHFLIYICLSTIRSWVKAIEHLPAESITLDERSATYWAAKTYGNVINKLMKTSKLDRDKKVYFLEIAVRTIQQLRKADGLSPYTDMITEQIFNASGPFGIHPDFVEKIEGIYRKVDHVLKDDDCPIKQVIKNNELIV